MRGAVVEVFVENCRRGGGRGAGEVLVWMVKLSVVIFGLQAPGVGIYGVNTESALRMLHPRNPSNIKHTLVWYNRNLQKLSGVSFNKKKNLRIIHQSQPSNLTYG